MSRVQVIEGDITKLSVDAIVNAANSSLLGGGGVDGAIHDAAGPRLQQECSKLGGCPTGHAKITAGHNLPAKFIIHTVGPVWHGGNQNEESLLAECYRNSLNLAVTNGIKSIAFPAISTGAFGFPMDRAAHIAAAQIAAFLAMDRAIEKIVLVCFDPEALAAFNEAVKTHGL
jgi:O-acetyl-ADP-ribose deacetylase (regulator of RNase III)